MKKAEVLELGQHYKLPVSSSQAKSEIRKVVLAYLVEEEVFSEDVLEGSSTSEEQGLELKRLEFQERDKAIQLKLKELEIREKELAVEYKAKEMELMNAKSRTSESVTPFDVGKHIRFVPPFQEIEVDKYFMHFEKIANSLKWPEDVWTVLLQSVFVGKAREIYSALPVEQSSQYTVVKEAVLKAYELVPEAYRQKFYTSVREDKQTYVEFARIKERLFDRWCASQNTNGEYAKLRELILIEEFKSCLSPEVKTYLDEQKVETLQRAATLADDYSLTHRKVFLKSDPTPKGLTKTGRNENSLPPVRYNLRSSETSELLRLSVVPTCYYCKKKGHVMSECWALDKKEKSKRKTDMLVKRKAVQSDDSFPVEGNDEYSPFISDGSVALIGKEHEAKPVRVLRDTGASQSLLEGVLPLSESMYSGSNVLLQGVELGVLSVPLHVVHLTTELVCGPVMIGVRESLRYLAYP